MIINDEIVEFDSKTKVICNVIKDKPYRINKKQ